MPGDPSFDYIEVRGAEIDAHGDALGQLRIAVFREFPYLYDGDLDYERAYLKVYAESKESLVVLLHANGQLVGATTCIPMADEAAEFQKPFISAGIDIATVLYFGESIILPEFRGAGAGHGFFARRQQHAVALGAKLMAFCAVDRPIDHPLRPSNYRPLDEFWRRMGFAKNERLRSHFEWKDIDKDSTSSKQLTYWTKAVPEI
ncbi:MAG: GNAT family N-acetyltransferase [Verrucomicrobia bacterium]|nr:GNAT family N-acetyltransferase [Verrucomicrobiota bacterium]